MQEHFKQGLIKALKFYGEEFNGFLTKDDIINIRFTVEDIDGASGYYMLSDNKIAVDDSKCSNPFRTSFVLIHELWHYIQFYKNERLLLDNNASYYDYENEMTWNVRHVEAEAVFMQCLYLLWTMKSGEYNNNELSTALHRTIHIIDKSVWEDLIAKLDNEELKNKLSWRD